MGHYATICRNMTHPKRRRARLERCRAWHGACSRKAAWNLCEPCWLSTTTWPCARCSAPCSAIAASRCARRPPPPTALELARELDFDAVLTDVRMPGRSGIELVGELRRMRPDTPVAGDDGLREHRLRRRGDAGRRLRLHRQALRARRRDVRGRSRARATRARGGEPPPAPRGRPDQRVRRSDRRQPGDAGDLRADPQDRARPQLAC